MLLKEVFILPTKDKKKHMCMSKLRKINCFHRLCSKICFLFSRKSSIRKHTLCAENVLPPQYQYPDFLNLCTENVQSDLLHLSFRIDSCRVTSIDFSAGKGCSSNEMWLFLSVIICVSVFDAASLYLSAGRPMTSRLLLSFQ